MYKYTYLFFLFFCAALTSDAQSISYSSFLEEGEETYVFGDTVAVRSLPDVRSDLIDTLYTGMPIRIIKKEARSFFLRGFSAPWVYVQYFKNRVSKEGYVWSGLLALRPMRRGNTKFVYGIERVISKDTLFQKEKITIPVFHIKLKVLVDQQIMAWQQFRVEGESAAFSNATVMTGKGLSNVQNIIAIIFSGEACGVPSYTYHYAWNGQNLVKLIVTEDISDAGVFYSNEELILPEDKGGQPGRLILKCETGESTERTDKNGDLIYKTKKSQRIYSWDGIEIKLVKS